MERLNETLDLSEKLGALRQQLAAVDAQRAALLRQIDECVNQLAVAVRMHAWPDTLAEQILWVVRRHGPRALGPMDVAAILKFTRESDFANVRTHLARLFKRGLVRKVAHGRYVIAE
jgi:hypothetical protein